YRRFRWTPETWFGGWPTSRPRRRRPRGRARSRHCGDSGDAGAGEQAPPRRSPAKATGGRHLRLAGVHRPLKLRRWRPPPWGGSVDCVTLEGRVGEVRDPVAADAPGPAQPRLLLRRGELL